MRFIAILVITTIVGTATAANADVFNLLAPVHNNEFCLLAQEKSATILYVGYVNQVDITMPQSLNGIKINDRWFNVDVGVKLPPVGSYVQADMCSKQYKGWNKPHDIIISITSIRLSVSPVQHFPFFPTIPMPAVGGRGGC